LQSLSIDSYRPLTSHSIIMSSSDDRYVLFPLKYPALWDMYKKHIASFWTVEEINFSRDQKDWATLTPKEQRFIKHVLAFFAASDGIVMENLAVRFLSDVSIPEARNFYAFQIASESIHSECYSLLIDTYIKDPAEKTHLFHAMNTMPAVASKATWAITWISSSKSFATRLLAFAIVEGVFFSGSFCAIFWLKKRGKMPGLTFSNELISRDEGLHVSFACLMYSMVAAEDKLPTSQVHDMVGRAVSIEKLFVCDAIPVELIGMNSSLMSQYIEYVADHLLLTLGYPKLYQSSNPFEWMEMISLTGKTNFFERPVGEYQRAAAVTSFTTDAEF
jgi:ribonucleotide reductase beta subunit family protein with ferritin-like domain